MQKVRRNRRDTRQGTFEVSPPPLRHIHKEAGGENGNLCTISERLGTRKPPVVGRVAKEVQRRIDEQARLVAQPELVFTDEDRTFDVSRLPICKHQRCCLMERKHDIFNGKALYQVHCTVHEGERCKTPWLDSSKKAVAHWSMMVLMENQ